MTDDALTSRANVVLHLDNGAEMQFSGRPFAGGSWFDDETGELTRQKLYTTESGEHVYSIVTGKAAAQPPGLPRFPARRGLHHQ
ncbi:MAG: hypothetical protein ACLSAH_10505 [Bilophila wadsworthia]